MGPELRSEGGEVGPVWGSRPLGAPLACACVGVMHTRLYPHLAEIVVGDVRV